MEHTPSYQQKAILRKRKRKQEHKEKSGNKKRTSNNGGSIDNLPDDILINVLSHMRVKEAARTSVLAHRWRHLWRFANGILRFGNRDTASGKLMKKERFESWVNTVLELHQAQHLEGMAINFEVKEGADSSVVIPSINSWVYFAVQKDVQMLEVNLSEHNMYDFPSVRRLLSHSHGVSSPLCNLRTLRLAHVGITDEMVHYFLASCPTLEVLCIHSSNLVRNLQVIDPPSLRVLEISKCYSLQSLKICSAYLVSLTYRGPKQKLLLEKIPNLRELSICDFFSISFVMKPKDHLSYSVQLERLVLDFRYMDPNILEIPSHMPRLRSLKRLEVFAAAGRTSLLYYRSLIKASPKLREFRIEMSYVCYLNPSKARISLISRKVAAKAMKFVHKNLKVAEIGGYTGHQGEEELVLGLLKIGPSIDRVVIDTEMDYFDFDEYIMEENEGELGYAYCRRQTTTTRNIARQRAKRFGSKITPQIEFVVT